MKYISTRGKDIASSSMDAIINGIAKDSGLYIPETIPFIGHRLEELLNLTYEDLAVEILGQYFNDLGKENLRSIISKAYGGKFKVLINNNFLELYHGPTLAFKDAALLVLPYLMEESKKILNKNNKTIILTATSGDTGKAALEGFKNIKGINVVILYPKDGVSDIQKYQMITQEGNNLNVIAIEGNFDDAQRATKSIFLDREVKEFLKINNLNISSANSINVGRLIPQVVYYFYGYFQKVNNDEITMGEKINISVPTGNFGNILAAYYAKKMGLPINKLICASNSNNVLTDFFNTGVYDSRRELILTETPSMDILVSSNLERLLFEVSHREPQIVNNLMNDLKNNHIYEIDKGIKDNLKDFYANYSNDEEVKKAIKNVYKNSGYIMDTHTAVAYDVYNKYVNDTGDTSKFLIVSTASPFKFVKSVLNALEENIDNKSDFQLINELSEKFNLEIPKNIKDLNKKEIRHKLSCSKDNIKETLIEMLKEKI